MTDSMQAGTSAVTDVLLRFWSLRSSLLTSWQHDSRDGTWKVQAGHLCSHV